VFLGVGLPGVNALGVDGEDAAGVLDAVDFIGVLRQAEDLSQLEIGRRVVVIGGGMTAIDAAMQAKLLGAEEVTVTYRRGQEHMNASLYEQELAQTHGIAIRHWLMPKSLKFRAALLRRSRWKRPRSMHRQACRHRRDRHHSGRPGVQGHRPDPGCRPPGGRFDHPRERPHQRR
jgi:NADPH-dependent glutamate synthase beta subunit-like oxidoreductase